MLSCTSNGKKCKFCFSKLWGELLINKTPSDLSKATGGCLEISVLWFIQTQALALISTELRLWEGEILPNNETNGTR